MKSEEYMKTNRLIVLMRAMCNRGVHDSFFIYHSLNLLN